MGSQRVIEWLTLSLSHLLPANMWLFNTVLGVLVARMCVLVIQSCPTLCDPWTVACQDPLSMGFSRQEYWSGLSFSCGHHSKMKFLIHRALGPELKSPKSQASLDHSCLLDVDLLSFFRNYWPSLFYSDLLSFFPVFIFSSFVQKRWGEREKGREEGKG